MLDRINGFVWGMPALLLILGVGAYLSFISRFAQITLFPKAVKRFADRLCGNRDSGYRALCTALGATVGTGNIAGVAGAIAIGGPGAIFWMWVSAFFGMVTKYAEAVLAVRYRSRNLEGEVVGGPMYYIQEGLGQRWKFLSCIYCFFGVVAAFGVGNATQINAVLDSVAGVAEVYGGRLSQGARILLGGVLAILVAIMLFGGAKRIGHVAEALVPFTAILYILLGLGVLILRLDAVPGAFVSILQGAFSPAAVTGGVVGFGLQALRIGTSRGVFTNEAGMGTAAIAHGAAEVSHPAEQGLMGIMEVFLDTIVICTVTALIILCSGVDIPYGIDEGAALTGRALSGVYGGWVSVILAVSLCLFAIATILGWGLYGIRCAQYLFGDRAWRPFVYMQAITVIISATLNTGIVWMLAETVNGLMAIPNLIALFCLAPEVQRLTREYKRGACAPL